MTREKTTIAYTDHIQHYITDAEVADYFKPNKMEAQAIRRRYEYFKTLLNLQPGNKLLEVGSGGGEALNILKDIPVTFFPTDLSHKNLSEIKKRAKSATNLVTGDVFNLAYKDESFERLIMSEVLEHLHDPAAALSEVRRVLKPGGKAVVSVPYKEKISYQLCVHCNQLTPTNAHLNSFDEVKLARLAEECAFKVEKISTFGNKAMALLRLNLLLRFLPFSLWKLKDDAFNLIIPKPQHMVALLSK